VQTPACPRTSDAPAMDPFAGSQAGQSLSKSVTGKIIRKCFQILYLRLIF
jgi:hypothetical protein